MRLQRVTGHRAMRWANGRGSTHEVIAVPSPGAWDWRLSIAEVNDDGPFSQLAGVDRALVVATGNGMTLRVGARQHRLDRFASCSFSGDDDSSATLTDGPVRDLNLMVRRASGHGRPDLRVERVGAGAPISIDGAVALVVLEGVVVMTTSVPGAAEESVVTRASELDVFLPEPTDASGGPTLHAESAVVLAHARLRDRRDRAARLR